MTEEDEMRRVAWFLLLLVLIPGAGYAQSSGERRVQGYGFAAPGGAGGTVTMHYGAGFDALAYKGLGLGGEIGYLMPAESPGDGFGVFSPNVSYHFLTGSKSGKFDPFVTGGYSLFFRDDTANAVNFGGGVNYWIKERIGLRFEIRDHVLPDSDNTHFYGFRVGVTFR